MKNLLTLFPEFYVMAKIMILAAKRTPLGCFQGSLSHLSSGTLASFPVNEILSQFNLIPDQCIVGAALPSGMGLLPGKQVLISNSETSTVPTWTISQGHNSVLSALIQGSNSIKLGQASTVLIIGVETVSNCMHILESYRPGRSGQTKLIDSLVNDGYKTFGGSHAGVVVERHNIEYAITRKEQDEYAYYRYKNRDNAYIRGFFSKEIVETEHINKDEELEKVEFMTKVENPLFYKQGTVTAFNSALPSDGAVAILISSEEVCEKIGVKPFAEMIGWGQASKNWFDFPLACFPSCVNMMNKSGILKSDIDLWEVNDYFSTIPLVIEKEMKLAEEVLNVNGGSVCIGDPVGASGGRHLVTLLHSLEERSLKTGVVVSADISGSAISIAVRLSN